MERVKKSLTATDEKLIRAALEDDNHMPPSAGDRQHLKVSNEYDSTGTNTPASVVSNGEPQSPVLTHRRRESSLRMPSSDGAKSPKKPPSRHRFTRMSSVTTESILDSKTSKESAFFGFYTLFWTVTAVGVIRQLIYNYLDRDHVFGERIFKILRKDLIFVALTDLFMYFGSYFCFILQFAIKKGYISWQRQGIFLQNVYQTCYLFLFLWISVYWEYPWIGRVFLLLHSLVFIMKQHSYAFYNGHFWRISTEQKLSQARLAKDRDSLDPEDIERLESSIAFCEDEIVMQSDTVRFPDNITLKNYFWYSVFPTLVYQIEYPRTNKIRWKYVAEKVAAVFGVFFLMIFLAEEYFFPIYLKATALKDESLKSKLQQLPLTLLDLIPPFVLMYLLVFYIIWDAILNALAELTMFGDRKFYGAWWNCVTWDQFSKEWNVPVHRFLLRHVYHSSIASMQLNKAQATFFTFFLSSCVHELVMLAIFGKLRGYLICLQMFQLPLVSFSRTKYMRDKDVLGNVIFWFGIITGPSILTTLYLTF